MIWTLVLVVSGLTGLWLAPRHWWGWAINSATEILWFVYAWGRGDTALMVMAVIWLVVSVRNTWVARYRV